MGFFSRNEEQPRVDHDGCCKLIEEVLRDFGLDPKIGRWENETTTGWSIRKGSAETVVIVHKPREQLTEGLVEVRSRVMTLPEDGILPLYRRLLELNGGTLWGASFGIVDDTVVLTAERAIPTVDKNQIKDLIDRVASYADRYDDELVSEFGGLRFSDKPR